jgi:hypothetical protein
MSGGQPVSAWIYEGSGAVSPPNEMIPQPGGTNDIWVYFYNSAGQRTVADYAGIQNDEEAGPYDIYIEGFDLGGNSVGRTEISGPAGFGVVSAPGAIYFVKIYSAPAETGYIGCDNFSYSIADTTLRSELRGTNIVLAWSALLTNFVLESSVTLTSSSWTAITNTPNLAGGKLYLTNSSSGNKCFYRLRYRAVAQTTNVIFYDDFESGNVHMWTPTATSPLDISSATNAVPPGGRYCAYVDNALDKMYHNLGAEIAGWSVITFHQYDSTAARAYVEVRGYTGAGYGQGTLENLYALGKYNTVSMAGEVYDATKYQGRVAFGPGPSGWFNLDRPGAPSRSPGWHRFDIVRTATGDYNFYVDGVLGRSLGGVTDCTWDSVTIGSIGSGVAIGDAWFDGVLAGTITAQALP